MIKIIKRSDKITDELAMDLVSRVIKQGKISGDNDKYCHLTVVKGKEGDDNIEFIVFCRTTKTGTIVFELSIE